MSSNTPLSPFPPLRYINLADIHQYFASNTLNSTQLVRTYLSRITEVDREFNSVIETNPDALAIAQARDTERANGHRSSILHGIPILLKDNIPTLDSTETTCGSLALIGAKPAQEATVVTALRNAGAVILGKANMAEWVGFRSTSGCSGWSARGGQTCGPFVKGSKASGSSSGSAVATALGLCFAAIGTETCYSIVSPAEKSGIVGYKPTKDLLSSEGIIYASKRQDTVGVLARTVEDAMLVVLEIVSKMTEGNSKDSIPRSIDSAEFLDNLKGFRIGVPLDLTDLKNIPVCKLDAFGRTLFRLEAMGGATIVTDIKVEGVREYEGLSQEEKQIVLDTDMKIAIEDYLKRLQANPHNIHNLRDLIEFTKACPGEEYPVRNVAGLERAERADPEGELYKVMVEKDKYFADCIETTLDRFCCDLLLIPDLSVTLQTFAAKGGSPVLSVPIGHYPKGTPTDLDPKNDLITTAPGIPFSVFIFGRACDDASVLKVGSAIERMMGAREKLKPYMPPTIEIVDTLKH
ncbi:amidase signature enzyme [Lizonia empirigonia]|nr:amidase signature enzyme [Lizonia empirigonia]